MNIFGSTGPEWESPGERRTRNIQAGQAAAQPFNAGFSSAYDQAREEKYKEEQMELVKKELEPVINSLKGINSYDQAMDWSFQHPEAFLNPRTSPFVNSMVKTWEAAEAVKTRMAASKLISEKRKSVMEFEAKLGSLPPEVQAQIRGSKGMQNGGLIRDANGMPVDVDPAAIAIINSNADTFGYLPFGMNKEEYAARRQAAGIAATAETTDKKIAADATKTDKTLQSQEKLAAEANAIKREKLTADTQKWQAQIDAENAQLEVKEKGALERLRLAEQGKGDRQEAQHEYALALEERREAFRERMAQLTSKQKKELSQQIYEQMSDLQKQKYEEIRKSKSDALPSTAGTRVKIAAKRLEKANDNYADYGKNDPDDPYKKAVFEAELELMFWLREQERTAATPATRKAAAGTAQGSPRKADFRWDPATQSMVPIE